MDASEREKERLRKLSELYEKSDLTDDQYRHEYNKIAAEYQDPNAQTGTAPGLDAPTFLETKAETKPDSASDFKTPKSSQDNSAIMHKEEGRAARDTFSSMSMPQVKPTVAMKRIRGNIHQIFVVPIIFLLGIGLALAIGIKRPGPTPPHGPDIGPQVGEPKPEIITLAFISPRFGPDAVEHCISRCSRWGEQEKRVCKRGCKRRRLEMYGKRITSKELSPRTEADAIVQECMTQKLKLPRAENEQIWRAGLLPFVTSLREAEKGKGVHYSREMYRDLYRAQAKATFPPEEERQNDELTKRIYSATCLIAQDALALWAFETVERQDDEYSATFYAKLREELTTPKFRHLAAVQKEVSTLWEESSP